jgi:AraC-like DNA-binding protein
MNYSILKDVDLTATFQGFVIMYVLEGVEQHTMNGRSYTLKPQQYLLGNMHSTGRACLKSKQEVHGLCVNIRPEIFAEVLSAWLYPCEPERPVDLSGMLYCGDFFEHFHSGEQTALGCFMAETGRHIRQQAFDFSQLNEAFFYRLAELYIGDYEQVVKKIRSIQASKLYTRKNMLRLVSQGKAYMDDCFANQVYVNDIARASHLSKYHFSRLFQAVYGVSPHRYLWEKRLQVANEMLHAGNRPVHDVAIRCGFADLASFSKAYKKRFGAAPSTALKISTF